MVAEDRYELLEKIGTGSFATVYRAKDRELGREVAVKQLHQEFLADPRRLDNYWAEAQLVASLHHPNIVTIHDIDRERGWLVMELMQANLAERMEDRQMDLKSLRTTMGHCLRVLAYLHERGIVHGDIKPSNMMIDERRRIKLGDFGLARRVANDEGSLLKGTTKYMAPEVVSDEFGEVGPPSDLYSLGFAAYDLMCGANFESLFPGMSAYGRNTQAAWMMWHAAPDRRLPKVQKVLEGVPDDLAHVIDKLIEKDQATRYATAAAALADLTIEVKSSKADESADQDADLQAAKGKMPTQRKVAIGAFAASLILCAVLLIPFNGGGNPEEHADSSQPVKGVVGQVVLEENLLIINQGADRVPREIKLAQDTRILLNDETYILLRELQKDDRVTITSSQDAAGKPQLEVAATRPQRSSGYVKALQVDNEQFMLVTDADRSELLITVSVDTQIRLNGKQARLSELQDDNRAEVYHVADEKLTGARAAASIVAYQNRDLTGIVREFSAEKNQLTVEVFEGGEARLLTMPIADKCNVTVNDQQVMNEKLLKPSDLQPGDRVTLSHHAEVFNIRADRKFHYAGIVLELNENAQSLVIAANESDRKIFVASPECEFAINGRPARLEDLRRNDRIEIAFDRSAQGNAATSIDATRPVDKKNLAIIIGNQAYDDATLTKLSYSVDDAKLLYETLLSRYACAPDQLLLLTNETRVRLEQAVPVWLKKATVDSRVVVYVSGHAYQDENLETFLAAKDFDLQRTAESGLALTWLRDQLETCVAGEKLLLLDCCHDGDAEDLKRQPSTAEMLQALKSPSARAVFKTTTAIASVQSGQRGLALSDKKQGLFGFTLAQAFSGKADKNRDVHIEPTELYEYLKVAMAIHTVEDRTQSPMIFIPDDTATITRLNEDAKLAIRTLLAEHWDRSRLSSLVEQEFLAAAELAGDEPDATMAYALILFKARDRKNAVRYFEEVKFSRSELLFPYEALAWMQFANERYTEGLNNASTLAAKIADRIEKRRELDENSRRLLVYLGKLRQYVESLAPPSRQPQPSAFERLDENIPRQGLGAAELFEQGRNEVVRTIEHFDQSIKDEKSVTKVKLLKLDRKRLSKHVAFDFDAARRDLLEALNK